MVRSEVSTGVWIRDHYNGEDKKGGWIHIDPEDRQRLRRSVKEQTKKPFEVVDTLVKGYNLRDTIYQVLNKTKGLT